MSINNLTIVSQLRCAECDEEIRLAGTVTRCGFPEHTFEHVGKPCRRYYGKSPEEHPGFPVDNPEPARRCAVCWPYVTRSEAGEPGDPRGAVTVRQEAWGDRTTCATCPRENWYSIED